MKATKMLTILVLALAIILCSVRVSKAEPMGTGFTYQGHLYDANHVANGLYDLAFKLYDANVGGSKAGTDVNVADVDVIDGYFTVELDFGDVYDGNERWLEIGVRPGEMNDPNVYTTLSPRQEVTPTPYAMHSENADKLDSFDSSAFASSVHDHDGDYVNEGQVNSITSAMIQNGTVTSSDIADGTITNADIASSAINSAKIQDGTITTADLSYSPMTNPYTGNVTINGTLDLTSYLDMNLNDLRNVDDIEADNLRAEDAYIGGTQGSGGATKGDIYVYDSSDNETIHLDSDWNGGGAILVKTDTGTTGVKLEADDYGTVVVYSDTGWANIQLIGGYGSNNGSVRVNGAYVHDYADVYSFVSSADPLPGQVVSIATDGKLDVSSTAYDSKVAGIVSGAGNLSPGMIVGGDENDPDTAPIAVSGRVYCYVDATEHAVEIGDLLTTSNTPGYAMKAIDRERAFGAVLGKAMQPLPRGEKGLVLVLVCLN